MYIPPHTQLKSYVTQTYTTGTGTECVPPTKEKCIKEIIYYATNLMKKKWWQDKKYWRDSLKLWCKRYEALSNKEE